jgi:hypothetical protein
MGFTFKSSPYSDTSITGFFFVDARDVLGFLLGSPLDEAVFGSYPSIELLLSALAAY